MKTISNHLRVGAEATAPSARDALNVPRFQIVVEYTAGVCMPTAASPSLEEAVELFLLQTPECEEGEIALVDRHERRIMASAKWTLSGTEIGLRVPCRKNVFQDWHLALIALEIQKRREVAAPIELIA